MKAKQNWFGVLDNKGKCLHVYLSFLSVIGATLSLISIVILACFLISHIYSYISTFPYEVSKGTQSLGTGI